MSKFKQKLLNSERSTKVSLVAIVDLVCISTAMYLSILVSGIELVGLEFFTLLRLFWVPFFSIFIFYLLGVYRSVVRYINFSVIYVILKAILALFLLILFLRTFLLFSASFFGFDQNTNLTLISNLGWFVGLTTTTILVIGSRIFANYFFTDNNQANRVIIYGAGSAGIQLASALKVSLEMNPIAFIDQNKSLHGTYLAGIKILSPEKLEGMVKSKQIDEVLIAMPSASKSTLKDLLRDIEKYSVRVRILPGLSDLASGKVSVSELKELDFEDLLGRSEVEANQKLLDKNIRDKVVLVTGSGGSIGSEIARQALKNKPKKLILLDSNEYSLYEIKEEIKRDDGLIVTVLADVKDEKRITDICKAFRVQTIYHAAAYKHVPLVEENPFEGVRNNIFGTLSCVNAAIETLVETFVLISTDKAVRPTNIMGASKRFAEMILQSMALDSNDPIKTKLTMVRFGNVLGSSGSALPLFKKQIQDGGPVTVTDPEIIRYFMSIPEAAQLVIQAGAMGEGGEVFLLDMGEPVKILELAKRLIKLSGYELIDEDNPNGDIEIVFTGLRPGEKLYEELLIGSNSVNTTHKQIYKANEDFLNSKDLKFYLDSLKDAEQSNDVEKLKSLLKDSIHGFTPEKEIVDIIQTKNNN